MKRTILNSFAIAGLLFPIHVMAAGSEMTKERAEQAVVLLNHLNWVVSRVEQNKEDAFVIEEEYENLTDNNINLATIEDEEIAQEIVALMHVFTDIRETIMDLDALHGTMELKRKAAIYKAIPNPGVVVSPNPYLIAIRLAESAATSFMNYQAARSEMLIERIEKKLEIDKRKLRALNAINEELFWRQWQIVQKHKLLDCWRTARSDCRELVALLSISGDNADFLIYSYLKRYEVRFSYLPIYWYYRMQYAMKGSSEANWPKERRDDVLYSCKQFEKYHKDILRKDRICAMVSIMAIGACKGDMKLSERKRHLNVIVSNMKTHDWDLAYFAAREYIDMGMKKEALDLLQGMVDNLEAFYLKYDASEHVFDVATMKNLEPLYCIEEDDLNAKLNSLGVQVSDVEVVRNKNGGYEIIRHANFPSHGLSLCRLLLCSLKIEVIPDDGKEYVESVFRDAGMRNVSLLEKLECAFLLKQTIPTSIKDEVKKLSVSVDGDALEVKDMRTWMIGLHDKVRTKVTIFDSANKSRDISPDYNQSNQSGSHYDKDGKVICKTGSVKSKEISKVEVELQFGGKDQCVKYIYKPPFSRTTPPSEVYFRGKRIL